MEISVDQYAALHQHYDSILTALSMSLQCELLDLFHALKLHQYTHFIAVCWIVITHFALVHSA